MGTYASGNTAEISIFDVDSVILQKFCILVQGYRLA